MKKLFRRYRNLVIVLAVLAVVSYFNMEFAASVFSISKIQVKEMMLVIPPIFILLGLLDVWISKETMSYHMGEGSGLKGILLALLIGSAAAGPLYGAFPVAAVFMKKGVKFSNVLIFIGAWSTTKIPMFLFEIAALGPAFAVTRLLIDIPGVIIIAQLLSLTVSKKEVDRLYENAQNF
ncbi:MAG: permease [Sphaerochaetaceae bacterium]|nr:permease [Sphaerochaetaceae bacterium]